MNRETLIAFERDVADAFNAGLIRAPIHLDGGNEAQLIKVFKDVRPGDWVLCSWRSHYKALLHGVPPEKLKAEIMAGRSISLCFPEHRFLSSAIFAGHLPIALGIAAEIKRRNGDERVWVFLGDMAALSGLFHECAEYAARQELPIRWIVEDNGKSVCTPTEEAWGERAAYRVQAFRYELPWPHSGAGERVTF